MNLPQTGRVWKDEQRVCHWSADTDHPNHRHNPLHMDSGYQALATTYKTHIGPMVMSLMVGQSTFQFFYPGWEGKFIWERSHLATGFPPALPPIQGPEDHFYEVSLLYLSILFLLHANCQKAEVHWQPDCWIGRGDLQHKDFLHWTDFWGGASGNSHLFHLNLSFFIHTFSKVAVQLYLIYMMNTKVDKSFRTERVTIIHPGSGRSSFP